MVYVGSFLVSYKGRRTPRTAAVESYWKILHNLMECLQFPNLCCVSGVGSKPFLKMRVTHISHPFVGPVIGLLSSSLEKRKKSTQLNQIRCSKSNPLPRTIHLMILIILIMNRDRRLKDLIGLWRNR